MLLLAFQDLGFKVNIAKIPFFLLSLTSFLMTEGDCCALPGRFFLIVAGEAEGVDTAARKVQRVTFNHWRSMDQWT